MGQKIHPYGYRVGITQPHSARWFANSYQYPQYVFEDFLLRQSLFKNLPVENLPRKRSDDKSETKLVQIKIERLIRNTIKIKLYMTSPENFSELFERDNVTKLSKKDSANLNQNKVKTNKDANLLLLNIQKKLLNKRILHLKLLKLKNMHYKFLTIQNLLDKKASINTSNKIIPSSSHAIVNKSNVDLTTSYTAFPVISGLKQLLTEAYFKSSLSKENKIKYLFYFIQLKIKFFKNLDRQINFYLNLQKQKDINVYHLNSEQQLRQLKALQKQSKTLLQYLTTISETLKNKLMLQLEKCQVSITFKKSNAPQTKSLDFILEKYSNLINILKTKYILQKNLSNKLEYFILQEKIAEIKLRWFTNFKNSDSLDSSTSNNFKVQLQKQKLLTILTKFKVYFKFYHLKLEKIKQFLKQFSFLGSKLKKKGSRCLTELNIFLSKSFLTIKKFDSCLSQNSKILKERLIAKINTLTILQQNFKENLYLRKILILVENYSLKNAGTKFSLVNKNFIKLVNSSLNKGVLLTNKNLLLAGFNNDFGKYTYLLKNKVINSNAAPHLTFLKKEYLFRTIQSISNFKTSLKVSDPYTKLYKFSSNLLNQRYKLNKILEMKLKYLLLNNKLVNIKIFNTYLKTNTLIINQLVNWVKMLKKKLTENTTNNLQVLRTRIYKINCYLKKILNQAAISEMNKSAEGSFNSKFAFKIEKNLIFLNYNILKQKLILELLKLQRAQILSQNTSKLSFSIDAGLVVQNLSLQNSKLQKRVLELENQFKQDKNDGDRLFQLENKMNVFNTLSLKTNLQELLKQNYQSNFVVLQSRRKVYNAFINRFGGIRNNTTKPLSSDPFETMVSSFVASSFDKNSLLPLLDAVKEKIYERKPLKLKETRKQKFLTKKTIKKKLKLFLILLSLQNNYNNLATLKNIYNGQTLANVCDNFTTLQTLPKVSVIELVKVRQPKQYAVCLANFIVENLEKRFSFRSTMKKAAEQAMSTANVKGIKIQIAGRLNGAEIARTEWLRDGVVPLQTLRANIDYSYKTAKTIYGILGVKVWLFKDSPTN